MKKILIVDDDGSVRMTLRRMLTVLGWAVVEAETEAVASAILSGSAQPELVITDLWLGAGAGSGLGVMKTARRYGVPALLMTGEPTAESEANGYAVILKPFTLGALRDALAEFEGGDTHH